MTHVSNGTRGAVCIKPCGTIQRNLLFNLQSRFLHYLDGRIILIRDRTIACYHCNVRDAATRLQHRLGHRLRARVFPGLARIELAITVGITTDVGRTEVVGWHARRCVVVNHIDTRNRHIACVGHQVGIGDRLAHRLDGRQVCILLDMQGF